MLDEGTLQAIQNISVKERIALVKTLLQSLQEDTPQEWDIQTEYFQCLDFLFSPPNDEQRWLNIWKKLSSQYTSPIESFSCRLQNSSVTDRIALSEAIILFLVLQEGFVKDWSIQSKNTQLIDNLFSQSDDDQLCSSMWKVFFAQCRSKLAPSSSHQAQRPTFGFMKDTGSIHGDVVSPAVPESDWEVLR